VLPYRRSIGVGVEGMFEPPIGTVTFLFTDLEGSTTNWEHQLRQCAMASHAMAP
jgi:class 3 adenylate cyclase